MKTFVQAIAIILSAATLGLRRVFLGAGRRRHRAGGRDHVAASAHRGDRARLSARRSGPTAEPVRPVNLSPATRVLGALRQRGQTAATAESLTGGLVGTLLTAVPGSSERDLGARHHQLCHQAQAEPVVVAPDTLATLGPGSRRTAAEIAVGVAGRCAADWAWPPPGGLDRTRRTDIAWRRCTSPPPSRRRPGRGAGAAADRGPVRDP